MITGDPRRDAATLELLVEVLRSGARQTIRARGGSMEAAIHDGARIGLAPIQGDPRLGDVVAVATPGLGLVIHRIVGIDGRGGYLIKGDACVSPDGWFTRADIVAGVFDVDGLPLSAPVRPPPRWRRALRRLLALFR